MEEKRPAKRTRASVASFVKKAAGKLTGHDLGVAGLDMLVAARRDQVEANLTLFFDKVVRGEDVWSDGRFHKKIAQECDLNDFANLVEAVIREQDTAKMDVYAKLYTAFVDGNVKDPRLRRQMVLAARELTLQEIELVRQIYNAWKEKSPNSNDKIDETEQWIWNNILKPHDRQNQGYITLKTLERLGFMREKRGWGDPEDYSILDFTFCFVETAFGLIDKQAKQDDIE